MAGAVSLRLPDFIVGGAARSGTTWLYHLLDRHPDVEMAKPVRPEPKFFLVDEIYQRGLSYYSEKWFAEIPADKRAGEKSTNYLESESAARRIHDDLPEVRLLFILREPVDRAVSNWQWSRMNGMESLPFDEALRQETQREAGYPPEQRFSRPLSYFSRGLYRRMLQPYVDRFGLDRILVLRYEDIRGDTASIARLVHSFLEVPEREEDALGLGTINPSQGDQIDNQAIYELRRRYEEPNRELADLLGSPMWD
jgi:hypothetical protein